MFFALCLIIALVCLPSHCHSKSRFVVSPWGTKYMFDNGQRSWGDSWHYCTTMSSSLPTFSNVREQDWVLNSVANKKPFWLRARNVPRTHDFIGWIDGTNFNYSSWRESRDLANYRPTDCDAIYVNQDRDTPFSLWKEKSCNSTYGVRTVCMRDRFRDDVRLKLDGHERKQFDADQNFQAASQSLHNQYRELMSSLVKNVTSEGVKASDFEKLNATVESVKQSFALKMNEFAMEIDNLRRIINSLSLENHTEEDVTQYLERFRQNQRETLIDHKLDFLKFITETRAALKKLAYDLDESDTDYDAAVITLSTSFVVVAFAMIVLGLYAKRLNEKLEDTELLDKESFRMIPGEEPVSPN